MKILLWAAALLAASMLPAMATPMDYDFTITGAHTGSGVVNTDGVDHGGYTDVLGISGLFDGINIQNLLIPGGYAGNDNRLLFTTPWVTFSGVSFSLLGGQLWNIYNDTGGDYTITNLNNPVGNAQSDTAHLINLNLTPSAVPEPLTISLFGAGLAGLASMRRRKKAVTSNTLDRRYEQNGMVRRPRAA